MTFIPAPDMPEIGDRLQRLPLAEVGRRDSMANVTAEGPSGWIMWSAHLTAIEVGDGNIEARIKRTDFFSVQVGRRAQNTVEHSE